MKNFHSPVRKLIEYYARKSGAQLVLSLLAKGDVSNETEAKALLDFLEVMSEAVAVDARNHVSVLENEIVHTSDAVKISDLVESYLEERGFGHLLPDDE